MAYRRTLRREVGCTGIGLHSGKPVKLILKPAPAGYGLRFYRTDVGVEIPATLAHLARLDHATTLSREGVSIETVEHLLSALRGLGVDDLRIEVDGPEIPILDGSAAPFVALVREAGAQALRAGRRFLVIDQSVEVRDGDKVARLDPSDDFSVEFTADFDHPLITDQSFRVTVSDRAFEREVARARTFCFRKDIERMQAAGLARGGSLANAIVVDEFSIVNPEGLRFPDEFARHKVLDAIGDLALSGFPVLGALTAVKSGHALNQALVKKVLADPASHRVVRVTAEADAPRRTALPALTVAEGRAR